MQTPIKILNIGGDVAKDEIVVACSEGSFPTRPLANQCTALLAFLKKLPAQVSSLQYWYQYTSQCRYLICNFSNI